MTYDQYQEIYNAAKAQIADRVAKIQPRAGNRASVNGMGISIEPSVDDDVVEEETWLVTLNARVEGQYNEVGPGPGGAYNPITRQYETPFSVVATIPRTGYFTPGGDATGSDQAVYRIVDTPTPPIPPFPDYYKEFRLFLKSGSTDTKYEYPFKVPLRVEVVMVYRNSSTGESEEVATFTFDVGYGGASLPFVAPRSGTPFEYYTLNLKSIVRTE